MKFILIIFLAVLLIHCEASQKVCKTWHDYLFSFFSKKCYEDINVESGDATAIALRDGYSMTAHSVKTKDNYVLQIFRIEGGKNVTNDKKGMPIILAPSIFESATIFLGVRGESIAYMLADAGYDVFIANFRGSKYSDHLNYKVTDKEFWEITIDEVAKYDVPSILDFVSEETKRQDLLYLGHTIGGTVLLIHSMYNPEENRIKLAPLITPTGDLQHTRTRGLFADIISKHSGLIWSIISNIPYGSFLISYHKTQRILPELLFGNSLTKLIYFKIVMDHFGENNQITPDRAPYFAAAWPDGCSFKEVFHVRQLTVGPFAKFSYTLIGNKKRYGSSEPPRYNLGDVKLPIFMVYSNRSDNILVKEDAEILYGELPEESKKYGTLVIGEKGFNNMAFLFGKDAKKLVFDPILKLLSEEFPPDAEPESETNASEGDDNDTQRKLPIPNEPPPPLPAGAGSGGPSLDAVQFPSGDVRYVSE